MIYEEYSTKLEFYFVDEYITVECVMYGNIFGHVIIILQVLHNIGVR